MRWLVAIVVLAICAVALARSLVAPRNGAPGLQRFPSQVLAPGELPALWVFVRAECVHCRRHVENLATAMARLPLAARRRAGARVHIVGDLEVAAARQHPRSLHEELAIRSTPLTWWVSSDLHIQRAWLGARDETAWTRALEFVQDEKVQP